MIQVYPRKYTFFVGSITEWLRSRAKRKQNKKKEEKKTKSSKVYYLSCNSLFRLGVTSKKSARKVRKHTSLLPFSSLIFVPVADFRHYVL